MEGAPWARLEDRRAAIASAIAAADPARDAVLLAGKGHETYQIRGTTKYPFDEAEIVRDLTLSASGLLSKKIGGPSVRPPQPKPGDWEPSPR